VTAAQDIDLMQAAISSAKYVMALAVEMLVVQHDFSVLIRIGGKTVQCSRIGAFARDRRANVWRQACNVFRVIAIRLMVRAPR